MYSAHQLLTPHTQQIIICRPDLWSGIRKLINIKQCQTLHRHFPLVVALYSPLSPVCKIVEISKYWNDNFNLGFKSRQASHVRTYTFHPTPGWKVHFRWGQINPSVIKIQPRSKSWFIIRSDNKSRNFIPSCEPNVILNRPTLDFHKSKKPSALVLLWRQTKCFISKMNWKRVKNVCNLGNLRVVIWWYWIGLCCDAHTVTTHAGNTGDLWHISVTIHDIVTHIPPLSSQVSHESLILFWLCPVPT